MTSPTRDWLGIFHSVGGASYSWSVALALKQEHLGSGARVRIRAGWETGNGQGRGGGVKTVGKKICEVRGLLILCASSSTLLGTSSSDSVQRDRVFPCVP